MNSNSYSNNVHNISYKTCISMQLNQNIKVVNYYKTYHKFHIYLDKVQTIQLTQPKRFKTSRY